MSALFVNIKVTSAFITFANIQGATYGLIASSLNHIAHVIINSKSVKYSTENAKKVYKEIFGEIPNYTDIIADGTAPSSYTNDGVTVSDGVVYKGG